jgi:3D (Asp-Asp-Asp) domain-containing protein
MQFFCRARGAMAVMALALAACEGPSAIASGVNVAPDTEVAPVGTQPAGAERDTVSVAAKRGGPLGTFRFTMYYVAIEGQHRPGEPAPAAAAEPMLASAVPGNLSGPPDKVTLYEKQGCTPIAEIDRSFARELDLQGTGKLRDGRVLNTSGLCRCPNSPCFFEIEAAWAIGANGRLAPFRSVAIDTRLIELGSLLYIPELDGVRMPGKAPWGGYVHDGCVLADDRGGGIRGHELDLFVAKRGYVNALRRKTRLSKVTVFDGTGWCEKKNGRVRRAAGSI